MTVRFIARLILVVVDCHEVLLFKKLHGESWELVSTGVIGSDDIYVVGMQMPYRSDIGIIETSDCLGL